MRNLGVNEVNQINQNFYKKHSRSFSNSRDMNFWKGFEVCKSFLKPDFSVLDLGCGNARFLQYLKNEGIPFKSYLGIDSEKSFITENKRKFPEGNFRTQDILDYENFQSTPPHDLVCVFGVTHHIPDKDFRLRWFSNLRKLVSLNGYMVISFWNFNTEKSVPFEPKEYVAQKGDYFLGWKQDFSEVRFCHQYDKEELKEIIILLSDFNLVEEFEADSNYYFVFKKN